MSKYFKAEDIIAFLNLHCPKEMWEYQIAELPTIEVSEDCISREYILGEAFMSGEYNRETKSFDLPVVSVRDIEDAPSAVPKDHSCESTEMVGEWIPCSERLPENDGDYLAWARFNHEDDYAPSVINYDACAEAFGVWDNYFDPDTLGFVGSDFIEIDVIAWQPLPEPWKGVDNE